MIDLMPKWRLLILFFIAFFVTWVIFAPILKIAKSKSIVDNPGNRKLQKEPVPIMGGVVVFFGIAVGLMFFKTMFYQSALLPVLAASIIMLYLGTIDDILDVPPMKRLAIEIIVALLMIYGSRCRISHFQGLWGIEWISQGLGIPLTVLTIVGLINAINLIDGIDGLLPGLGIMILGFLGLLDFLAHDYSNAALAAVSIGALATFWMHNVFGEKSKMFLGDGGSMLLGIIISWLIISMLSGRFYIDKYLDGRVDFNLVSFCLAVVGIPVADTLRVMFARIFAGRSPFTADNNHLHHLFLACGYSHLITSLAIMGMAFVIIIVFLLVWALGASPDAQLYTVIGTILLFDGGGALLLKRLHRCGFRTAGCTKERNRLWQKISRFVDKW